MEENDINWWKTPPQLPDQNPIELLWHELKHFLRNIVKPKSKDELVAGISSFWYAGLEINFFVREPAGD